MNYGKTWEQIAELQRSVNQKLTELMELIDVNLFDTGPIRDYKEEASNVIIRAQREFNHVCKVYLQDLTNKTKE
ncbi:MAG: hypothetical protein GX030_03390 [Firmicutes bacterium]|nr:hypothetical protein [Bacillota bacterium]